MLIYRTIYFIYLIFFQIIFLRSFLFKGVIKFIFQFLLRFELNLPFFSIILIFIRSKEYHSELFNFKHLIREIV